MPEAIRHSARDVAPLIRGHCAAEEACQSAHRFRDCMSELANSLTAGRCGEWQQYLWTILLFEAWYDARTHEIRNDGEVPTDAGARR